MHTRVCLLIKFYIVLIIIACTTPTYATIIILYVHIAYSYVHVPSPASRVSYPLPNAFSLSTGFQTLQLSLMSIHESFLTNAVKVAMSSMQSLIGDKNFSMIKFSPMRASGKNFLMVKISTYSVTCVL